jgi:hypothetical protein
MRRCRKERDQRRVQLGRMQMRTFVVVRAFATEVVEADCIQVEVNTVPAFVVAVMRAFGFWVVPADLVFLYWCLVGRRRRRHCCDLYLDSKRDGVFVGLVDERDFESCGRTEVEVNDEGGGANRCGRSSRRRR